MAQKQQRIRAAALKGYLPGEVVVCVKNMTEEDQEEFERWKL